LLGEKKILIYEHNDSKLEIAFWTLIGPWESTGVTWSSSITLLSHNIQSQLARQRRQHRRCENARWRINDVH